MSVKLFFIVGAMAVGLGTASVSKDLAATSDSASASPSQQSSQPPVFRSGVDLVQLDVTVLDKHRQPVRGLAAADFTILENGKPRPVLSVAEIEVPVEPPDASRAAWVRDASRDVESNALPDGRLLVLVIDDGLLPPDPSIVNSAKKIAHGVIDRMGPADLAAIVLTRQNAQHAQMYTQDRAKLRAAVDKVSFGTAYDGPDLWYFSRRSMRTIFDTVALLERVPERRKAVVYISPGVPYVEKNFDVSEQIEAVDVDVVATAQQARAATRTLMGGIMDRALRANVNVYAIDPAGLAGMEFWHLNRRVAAGGGDALERAYSRARSQLDYLQIVANETGGRAIIHTNDFEPGLDAVFEETSHYYLLAYAPEPPFLDGKYRRLKVNVAQPDAQVVARQGMVQMPSAATRDTIAFAPTPDLAIAGLLPRAEIPLQITVAPFAGADQRNAQVALGLGAELPDVVTLTESQVVTVQARLFTVQGHSRPGGKVYTATFTRPDGQYARTREFVGRLDVPPGRYELRVSLTREGADDMGSVYTSLEVPDFRRVPLSLSGVVLTDGPGPTVLEALDVPLLPTTRRTFTTSDRVEGLVRVYRRARETGAVAMALQIQDTQGASVWTQNESLEATAFSAPVHDRRERDVRFQLPLARLAPGDYLLTIGAAAGSQTATREVRFTVRS